MLSRFWQQRWQGDVDVQKFSSDAILQNPEHLLQAISNQGLFARKSLVIITQGRDGLTSLCKQALPHLRTDGAVLLLMAAELDSKSSLRKFAEAQKQWLAIPAYEDSANARLQFVQQYARQHGFTFEKAALDCLSQHQVADRRLLRQDLEKIDLYRGTATTVSLPIVQAMLANEEQEKLDETLLLLLRGQKVTFETLSSSASSDITPHAIMRGLLRLLQKLLQIKANGELGVSVDVALKQARVFYKLEPLYKAVLSKYSVPQLQSRLHAVLHHEISIKRNHTFAQPLVQKILLQLSRV